MVAFSPAARLLQCGPIPPWSPPIWATRWSDRMLVVEKLAAAYGPAQVLFDVTFSIGAGEVVTLLGRNGMGKTTTIRTLMGLVQARDGAATFEGRPLSRLAPCTIAQAGLGLVPEG